jgi:hypothetical protein
MRMQDPEKEPQEHGKTQDLEEEKEEKEIERARRIISNLRTHSKCSKFSITISGVAVRGSKRARPWL